MTEVDHPLSFDTPILDSGILPPRVRRKIGVGTIMGFVGGFFVALTIVKAVGEQADGSSKNGIVEILIFIAALLVSIFIHELGHLAAGWVLGFRFGLISVGPLELHIEHGRFKVSFLREMTALGYAGMHIDGIVRLRRRLLIYAAGGPAANVLTLPLAAMFANHTSFASTHPSSISFAAQLTVISILLSLVSLLPVPLGPTSFTDGSRIAMLFRDRVRARRLMSICAVGALYQNGIHPKNWRQTWLKAASSLADESLDDFSGNWLAYICIYIHYRKKR
jgi:Zn-dependent protease